MSWRGTTLVTQFFQLVYAVWILAFECFVEVWQNNIWSLSILDCGIAGKPSSEHPPELSLVINSLINWLSQWFPAETRPLSNALLNLILSSPVLYRWRSLGDTSIIKGLKLCISKRRGFVNFIKPLPPFILLSLPFKLCESSSDKFWKAPRWTDGGKWKYLDFIWTARLSVTSLEGVSVTAAAAKVLQYTSWAVVLVSKWGTRDCPCLIL